MPIRKTAPRIPALYVLYAPGKKPFQKRLVYDRNATKADLAEPKITAAQKPPSL
jgi:hypothetical protein